MQRTTTIEEISSNETINSTMISETIGITTIETTPTPAERQPHHHHHHHHHHHKHQKRHHQREENESTLVITNVSDDATLIVETVAEQPQDTHQHHHRHKHPTKEKQTAPQPPDPLEPPPLPTSTPPYLTPTEELTEVVWQTDLDLPPQPSAATLHAPTQQPTDETAPPPVAPASQWQPTMTLPAPATTTPATTTATTATQPAAVCQTELIIEPTQIAPPPPPLTLPTELVLVGTVSVEATDKPRERKSYRVSSDLAAPPQEPRKRCCCIIA